MNRQLHHDVIDLIEHDYRLKSKDIPVGKLFEEFTLDYAQALVSAIRTFCINTTADKESDFILRTKMAQAIAFGTVEKEEMHHELH